MSLPTLRTTARRLAAAGPSSVRSISTTAPVCAAKKKRPKVTVVSDPDAMPLGEAVRTLRALEIASPASAYSIEITTRMSKSVQILRGRTALPTDPRRVSDVIVVFAAKDSPEEKIAKDAGAHHVGGQELFEKILSEEIKPTKVLATPTIVPMVAKSLARFLGPKGLMPAAKRGTVADGSELGDLIKTVGGTLDWKGDKLGVIRAPIGRMTFTAPQVEANVRAFITAVRETSAAATAEENVLKRGKQSSAILRARIETTNGPSVELTDVL